MTTIERVCISIDTCWYLDKFIYVIVSGSSAWDNEMWQRRLYFILYRKIRQY